MKFIVSILLAAALLAGCSSVGHQAEEETTPETRQTLAAQMTTPPAENTEPGTYLPGSPAEIQTNGAVRAFDPGVEVCMGILPFGDGILLFSGRETTTLTLLKGENMAVEAQKTLDCTLAASDTGIQVNEQGIAFYDDVRHCVVFLDTELQETESISLPDEMLGNAVIAPDWRMVYYCTDAAVCAMDLDTGISQILKEQTAQWQGISGIFLNGSVLECYRVNADSTGETVYLSAQTGQTLCSSKTICYLATDEERYFASFYDGSVDICLVGETDREQKTLRLPENAMVFPMLSMNAVVYQQNDGKTLELSFVDLYEGKRTGLLSLAGTPTLLMAAASDSKVWMLCEDAGKEILYCWDPALSPVHDETEYTAPYYTAEQPDRAGLNRCKTCSAALGEKYGVNILIWEDPLQFQPFDYQFEAEFRVEAYERDLAVLETAMNRFPEGFFQQAVEGTGSGTLTVSLVRSINGDRELGNLMQIGGVQYWIDESAYLALAMGGQLEQMFYHELSHVIDSRVMSTCGAYDDWEALNPVDFSYDYGYLANENREDFQYLEEETRAFIDIYSMSYPKEDRARIFEYAMMPGNESFFVSEIMQEKLRTICLGIREAFSLETAASYPWEQYLTESLPGDSGR